MSRKRVACAVPLLGALALIGLASCRTAPLAPGDPSDLRPTQLDYVDSDGFDALLETSLVNQDPVILVRTGRAKPDWEGRLNAWIAAWNRGAHRPGRWATGDEPEPVARGQAPLPSVSVDGDSIREVRLLVAGLLDRIDDAAQSGAAWWTEERARSRRVGLLKPYSLRFHLGEDDLIQLVLFHGGYADHYRRYLQTLMNSQDAGEVSWSRSCECSGCCKPRDPAGIGRLTGRGESR
ncbi:MAG: hypothetical protein U0797_25585 [Gemmataceae bacterium]